MSRVKREQCYIRRKWLVVLLDLEIMSVSMFVRLKTDLAGIRQNRRNSGGIRHRLLLEVGSPLRS